MVTIINDPKIIGRLFIFQFRLEHIIVQHRIEIPRYVEVITGHQSNAHLIRTLTSTYNYIFFKNKYTYNQPIIKNAILKVYLYLLNPVHYRNNKIYGTIYGL